MPADTPNLHQNTPASQAEIMDGPEPEPPVRLCIKTTKRDEEMCARSDAVMARVQQHVFEFMAKQAAARHGADLFTDTDLHDPDRMFDPTDHVPEHRQTAVARRDDEIYTRCDALIDHIEQHLTEFNAIKIRGAFFGPVGPGRTMTAFHEIDENGAPYCAQKKRR